MVECSGGAGDEEQGGDFDEHFAVLWWLHWRIVHLFVFYSADEIAD
jgi:hypothetical protein